MTTKAPGPIVMFDSPEAATFRTVTGWVSRNHRFYGNDERTARYDGCTHRTCDTCCEVIKKTWITCPLCLDVKRAAEFDALIFEPYDGEPLSLFDSDEYFFDEDAVIDYCDQNEVEPSSLRLVKCVPIMPYEVDPAEFYSDDLPEDGEVPAAVADAFAELNAKLKAIETPLCWVPGKIRTAIVVAEERP